MTGMRTPSFLHSSATKLKHLMPWPRRNMNDRGTRHTFAMANAVAEYVQLIKKATHQLAILDAILGHFGSVSGGALHAGEDLVDADVVFILRPWSTSTRRTS